MRLFPAALAAAEMAAGAVGRWGLLHLRRLAEQVGFAGRLLRFSRLPVRGFMFRMTLEEVFKLVRAALPLTLLVGFITGGVGAFVWLGGPLASFGGSLDTIVRTLITVNSLIVAPLLVSVIVIFTYGSSIIWELAAMKATRQFETLLRLGAPPEHFLALPRIWAMVIGLPQLLTIYVLVSYVGAYLMIWQYTSHSFLAFVISLSDNARAVHIAAAILKSLGLSLSISFFTIYGGFNVEIGNLGRGSGLLSQALTEAFFFSTLIIILISVAFR